MSDGVGVRWKNEKLKKDEYPIFEFPNVMDAWRKIKIPWNARYKLESSIFLSFRKSCAKVLHSVANDFRKLKFLGIQVTKSSLFH